MFLSRAGAPGARLQSVPKAQKWAGLLLLLIASLGAAPSESGNLSKPDYLAFKLINERNIFNASRTAKSGSSNPSAMQKAVRVETLTLVGTMIYEEGGKGPFAFFDGASAEYRQVLEPGKAIAGCQLVTVTPNSVTLEIDAQNLELRVGRQLRREDGGAWTLVADGIAAAQSGVTTSASSADESDLVKRLMQQREQELK